MEQCLCQEPRGTDRWFPQALFSTRTPQRLSRACVGAGGRIVLNVYQPCWRLYWIKMRILRRLRWNFDRTAKWPQLWSDSPIEESTRRGSNWRMQQLGVGNEFGCMCAYWKRLKDRMECGGWGNLWKWRMVNCVSVEVFKSLDIVCDLFMWLSFNYKSESMKVGVKWENENGSLIK